MAQPVPHVPTSWGEVIDKITILQIKAERLPAEAARANAAHELALLQALAAPVMTPTIMGLAGELKAVNLTLWEVEDSLRDHEREARFDAEFVALARSVYRHNDARGALKRRINLALESPLVEEKSYRSY